MQPTKQHSVNDITGNEIVCELTMSPNEVDIAERFVAEVRGWLGVRFRYQGRDRKGIDCVGVVVLSLAKMGIELKVAPYGKFVTGDSVLYQLRANGHRVDFASAKPGDIALLNYRGQSNHIGVLTGEGTVIHSLAFAKRVVEQSLDHPQVKPHWVALYRLNCLEAV